RLIRVLDREHGLDGPRHGAEVVAAGLRLAHESLDREAAFRHVLDAHLLGGPSRDGHRRSHATSSIGNCSRASSGWIDEGPTWVISPRRYVQSSERCE